MNYPNTDISTLAIVVALMLGLSAIIWQIFRSEKRMAKRPKT
jgi:F0F1-type ATP synthase assembly protein I